MVFNIAKDKGRKIYSAVGRLLQSSTVKIGGYRFD